MGRAFLVVMDSLGIGGAPDAGAYYNGDIPDTGANTLYISLKPALRGRLKRAAAGRYICPTSPVWGLVRH